MSYLLGGWGQRQARGGPHLGGALVLAETPPGVYGRGRNLLQLLVQLCWDCLQVLGAYVHCGGAVHAVAYFNFSQHLIRVLGEVVIDACIGPGCCGYRMRRNPRRVSWFLPGQTAAKDKYVSQGISAG